MKKILIVLLLLLRTFAVCGQGVNHQWLLGYWNFQDDKGRLLFDSSNYTPLVEQRKMTFYGTQANISDAVGNLLMSSNGIWIANATGDTMMNGGGLNPGGVTPNWPNGLPMTANNLFLPYPGDSNKFALFHHTASFNGVYYPALEIFYSIIDVTQDGGLGSVITKNQIALQDTFSWGLGACKHANGKDWWVVAIKDYSDIIFKFLVTDSTIHVSNQSLGITPTVGASVQLTFSQDGSKFICANTNGGTIVEHEVRLLDFDRCSGIFSNPRTIDVADGNIGWGLAFSPSGKFIYACSSIHIFQIDTDNLSVDTVATYDGFVSPVGSSCCATTFWNMYLAANGKIYVTSGSGVQHIHEINYPDSAGIACDVQQHAIDLGYAHLRSVPNHPNYYLGCDTTLGCPCLTTGIEKPGGHDFRFNVAPNPTNGNFKITYLLPQNKSGKLEVVDINGRRIYEMNLPPWSTMQEVELPKSISAGVYNCMITSGGERGSKKVVVYRE
jgi:hypothetical protein